MHPRVVLVTEAPAKRRSRGSEALGRISGAGEPAFVPRERKDPACIVYSSGTAGRPKGCVLTHENYLEQCMAVTPIFPFWPGARYLSIIPTNHAIDFMGGFIMPFTGGGTVVHLRTLRPEFIRDAFTRYKITYMAVVPLILTNLQRGLRERFAALSPMKRRVLNALISDQSCADAESSSSRTQPHASKGHSSGFRRQSSRASRGRRIHRTCDHCVLSRSGHSDLQRLRMHGGVYGDHVE